MKWRCAAYKSQIVIWTNVSNYSSVVLQSLFTIRITAFIFEFTFVLLISSLLNIYIYIFFFFIAFVSLFWSGQKNISAWVSNGHYVFDVGVHAGYLCISILTIQLVKKKKMNITKKVNI